jgi:hypothetical protein
MWLGKVMKEVLVTVWLKKGVGAKNVLVTK